jgi:hypothetical protein
MSVTSGKKSSESWAKCNPDGSWVRTSPVSSLPSLEDSSVEWSMTWPKWGIAWAGQCMELKMSEPSTAETESSLLPTPRANQAMAVDLQSNYAQNHKHQNLEVVIAKEMLPTLRANQAMCQMLDNPYLIGRNKSNLEEVIANLSAEGTGENGTLAPSSTRPVLNPEFVESMMGFPIGWTDCEHSETQ